VTYQRSSWQETAAPSASENQFDRGAMPDAPNKTMARNWPSRDVAVTGRSQR
jgi:hypothetical protein